MSVALGNLTNGYLQHVPRLMKRWDRTNVNAVERGLSIAVGALTIVSALRQPGIVGRVLKLASGGALLARGLSGSCSVYRAMGVTSF
jgi:uncharacterized membrane protein